MTEYDALLDAHEQEARLDCGCLLKRNEESGQDLVEFYFCAMHKESEGLSFEFLPPTPRQVMMAMSHLSNAQDLTANTQVHQIINRAKEILNELLQGPLQTSAPSMSRPPKWPGQNRS